MRKNSSSRDKKPGGNRPYKKDTGSGSRAGDKKPYPRGESNGKPYDKPKRSFDGKEEDRPKRPYGTRDDGSRKDGERKRPYGTRDNGDAKRFEGGDRPKRSYGDRDDKPRRDFGGEDRPKRSFDKDDKPKRSYGDRDDKPRRDFGGEDRPKRSFDKDDRPKRSYGDRDDKPRRDFGGEDRPKRSFDKDDKLKRSYGDRDDKPRRDFGSEDRPKRSFDKDDKPKRSYGDRDDKPRRDFGGEDRPKRSFDKDDKPKRSYGDRDDKPKRSFSDKDKGKPKFTKREDGDENSFDKAYPLGARKVSGPFRKQFEKEQKEKEARPYKGRTDKDEDKAPPEVKEMTLNKYIAHSGTCGRREAAEMVKQGKVKINGELALDPGYRVQPFDEVTIAGKKLTPQKGRIYILLNKPKDYITTTDDPEGRRTIMDLVKDPDLPRLFPVGRLDRNTTGLILMTNDGDLAQKLSHPSYDIKKVYQVTLNKALTKAHFEQIVTGLTLDDGEVHVDALAYLEEKHELGLEIHSGRNRIVRRIFESLGYEVEKLDRMMYAGLTKKNLPRGNWRVLEEKEIIMLKHFRS
jgi:23S rRNA pseudouridine2605 synthase